MQKIHDSHLCCRFSPVSQFLKPFNPFSFLKTTLYQFPSVIQPKVEPPDPLGVITRLKSARFWCKMAVGTSFVTQLFSSV